MLAVEKRVTSPLLEPSSIEKVMEIDTHIGCALSGLTADARTMIDHARVEAQVSFLQVAVNYEIAYWIPFCRATALTTTNLWELKLVFKQHVILLCVLEKTEREKRSKWYSK